MEFLGLFIRLLIFVTFALAGIAKLADIEMSRKAIRDFGLPDRAAKPLGTLLPLAELAVACLLIPVQTLGWGAIGSLALLAAFVVGISVNMALGRKPHCNCFGQVRSEPIGWPTLVRNCFLIIGAGLVLWQERHGSPISLFKWTTRLTKGELVSVALGATELVVLAVGVWVIFHLLRQNGRILLRMDALEAQLENHNVPPVNTKPAIGLEIGSLAPDFELPLLNGGSTITLTTLLVERLPIILIFSDPDCGPCSALLPDLGRWEREYVEKLAIVLITRGAAQANQEKLGANPLRRTLLQKDREVAAAYQANGTPGGVLIRPDGTIGSSLVMGAQAIASLIADSAKLGSTPKSALNTPKANETVHIGAKNELKIGAPAPISRLPDLVNSIVDLAAMKEHDVLVLFWNPNCGFCSKMLPDLKVWEQRRQQEDPQLLIVSSGTVDANRSMGLQSQIVLDQNFSTGSAFRVRGTPAAVLVDKEGRIASGIATGAAAVFALASSRSKPMVPVPA